MDMNRLRTNWIWLPNWIPEDDSDARIVYFRKEMMVDDALPAKKAIKITADSRYKLYINEKFVQEGYRSPWIRKNGLLILPMLRPTLCRGQTLWRLRCCALRQTRMIPCTAPIPPACTLRTARLITLPLPGKSGWKCTINREIAIVGEAGRPAPIHAQENVYATEFFAGWKLPGCST